MSATAGAPASQRGFTLLEVLVAVTLLALLSVGLFDTVRVGVMGWRHAERQQAAAEDSTAVQDVLRRMIAAARPVFVSPDLGNDTVAFSGGPRSLSLVGTLPDALAPGLQGQERLFLVRSGAGFTLMLAWRLDLPSPEGGAMPESVVPLLDHVADMRISYLGPSDDGSVVGWADSWLDRRRLPSLVRIRLRRDEGGPGPWPDLLAAPIATAATDCRFAVTDSACHRIP
jgi:general secretion pathway protein J